MRKVAAVSLLTITLFLLGVAPSYAWHHGRVFIGVGVGPVWWGPPYWYYPPPYYYGYSPPPVVVEQQPPVYIQQEPAAPPPPPPAAAQAPAAEAFWYYCPSAKGYYPSVPTCPEAWIKVSPRP